MPDSYPFAIAHWVQNARFFKQKWKKDYRTGNCNSAISICQQCGYQLQLTAMLDPSQVHMPGGLSEPDLRCGHCAHGWTLYMRVLVRYYLFSCRIINVSAF